MTENMLLSLKQLIDRYILLQEQPLIEDAFIFVLCFGLHVQNSNH